MAVAQESRQILLDYKILPPCISLIQGLSLTPITVPVVMKLLAALRLLVDGRKEVSLELGESNPEVLGQIITYGNGDVGGPGIKAESGRLLSGILKNCHSKKVNKQKKS